jgi:predicted PurR-regulated permease PerM
VLIIVFIAVLFAAALSRPAAALERRGVPRGWAVGLVQAVGIGVVVGLVWVVVPRLVTELAAGG